MTSLSDRPRATKLLPLTASYTSRRTRDGFYLAEVLEARNVYTQGRTLREARENLADVIRLLLDERPAAKLFGHPRRRKVTAARDPVEKFYLVLP